MSFTGSSSSKRFFFGYSGFPLSKFQFDLDYVVPFPFQLYSPDNFGDDEGLDVTCWLFFLSFFTAAEAALVGRLEVMWLSLRPNELLDLEGTPAELDFFSSSHAAKMFRATCPLTHLSR